MSTSFQIFKKLGQVTLGSYNSYNILVNCNKNCLTWLLTHHVIIWNRCRWWQYFVSIAGSFQDILFLIFEDSTWALYDEEKDGFVFTETQEIVEAWW